MNPLIVAPLAPEDAPAVRRLLIDGLTERWGSYDASRNPDIGSFPPAGPDTSIVVARLAGQVVGTGTLRLVGPGRAEIVRMSVAAAHRRAGIGKAILDRLLDIARERGASKVCLETTSSWTSAIRFYSRHGFRKTHEEGGDTYFEATLG